MVQVLKNKVITDGVNSDIPCVACEHGLYTCHCVTQVTGEQYVVMTCDQCGDWDFHDRYKGRMISIMDWRGYDGCSWSVDPATGLDYMVVDSTVEICEQMMLVDTITEAYMEAGDDIALLRWVLLRLVSIHGTFYQANEVEYLTVCQIREDVEFWIDVNQ